MKCREIQPMMRTFIVRALSFSAVAALTLNPALTPVLASDYRTAAPVTTDGQMNARFVSLGVGKSIVIDLPREVKDVLVADPKVANAITARGRIDDVPALQKDHGRAPAIFSRIVAAWGASVRASALIDASVPTSERYSTAS